VPLPKGMHTSVGFFISLPMEYTKQPLTLEEQARLLCSRGMIGNIDLMIERLRVVNYYRLSGYWYPFRNRWRYCHVAEGGTPRREDWYVDDTFQAGTSFEKVWNRYVFDRRLRLVVLDAIERLEVALRTQIAYHHVHYCKNPFAYVDNTSTSLPNLRPGWQRDKFLKKITEANTLPTPEKPSPDIFVNHFFKKYGDTHTSMPVWMVSELLDFGCTVTFYRGLPYDVQKAIFLYFGVEDKVFLSWLLALNSIRNICAHHGRLWNIVLGNRPLMPSKKDMRWCISP
jgi:abortive infection bacteriophage resistance protein